MHSLLEDIAQEWAPRHEEVKGVQAVCEEDAHKKPLRTKKSPRPLCHVSTREGLRLFRESLRAWAAAFAQASARFRQGHWHVEFPPWAFRPPVHSQYQVCGT